MIKWIALILAVTALAAIGNSNQKAMRICLLDHSEEVCVRALNP